MRHWALALVTVCATALNAAAQTAAPVGTVVEQVKPVEAAALTFDPFFIVGELRTADRNRPTTTPDVVVARLMSFDRNKDGKVTVDELSERMQGLVARGDRGGDGALDADEVRALAVAPVPVQVKSAGALSAGTYTFGDGVGFDSRMHIEGAIEDLRLARGPREQAMVIAAAFVETHEKAAMTELMTTLAPIVPAAELKKFASLLEQTSQVNTPVNVALVRTSIAASMLSAQLTRSSLGPEQLQQTRAALETFRQRQQLTASDRTQLLAELGDLLSVEERDNLNAALARRPLVKSSTTSKFSVGVTF